MPVTPRCVAEKYHLGRILSCRFYIEEQKRKVLESNAQVRRGMFYTALCRVSVECCSSRGVLAQVSSGVMSRRSDSSSGYNAKPRITVRASWSSAWLHSSRKSQPGSAQLKSCCFSAQKSKTKIPFETVKSLLSHLDEGSNKIIGCYNRIGVLLSYYCSNI